MAHRWTPVAVSSAQLAAQVAGHVVAVQRRRHYDVPFMTGSVEHVARDWLWFGTAYSAPPYLLGPQVWAIARLLRGPDDRARRVVRWLGTGLTLGYLSERWNRTRVRPGGFDPLESPIVAVGWGCATAMAVLARRRGGQAGGVTARRRRPRSGLARSRAAHPRTAGPCAPGADGSPRR